MQAAGKTPVNVVQEIIAIHTNRKEAYQKMVDKTDNGKLKDAMQKYIAQSDRFIAALMNELSGFGDGVAGEVDMENDFNNTWRQHAQSADNFTGTQVSDLVNTLEQLLPQQYQNYTALNQEMPEPTRELLKKQQEELVQQTFVAY